MNKQKIHNYYVMAAVVFLFLATAWGIYIGQDQVQLQANLSENAPFFDFLNSLPQPMLFLAIFLNNALKTLLVIILGFAFGLFPLYFLYANGVLLGMVLAAAEDAGKLPAAVLGIMPHGLLELPALVIAAAFGFWLGMEFIHKLARKKEFLPSLKQALSTYLYVVLPLILVAALIETYITPSIMALAQ